MLIFLLFDARIGRHRTVPSSRRREIHTTRVLKDTGEDCLAGDGLEDPEVLELIGCFIDLVVAHPEVAHLCVITLIGLGGAGFAWWRCQIADENTNTEKFLRASALWSEETRPKKEGERSSYMARVSAAVVLAELARKSPAKWEAPVMQVFHVHLLFPPIFGRDNDSLAIDPDSLETVEVIKAVERRKRKNLPFDLRESPFEWTEGGSLRLKLHEARKAHEWRVRNGGESQFLRERHGELVA